MMIIITWQLGTRTCLLKCVRLRTYTSENTNGNQNCDATSTYDHNHRVHVVTPTRAMTESATRLELVTIQCLRHMRPASFHNNLTELVSWWHVDTQSVVRITTFRTLRNV